MAGANVSTRRTSQSANGQNGNGRPETKRPVPLSNYFDRQPPFDLQAELGVLGSAFLMPEVLDDVTPLINAEDFYDAAHAIIYKHMLAMREGNRRFDEVLLIDRMKAADEYDVIGGAAYLSKIIHAVPNAAHGAYYAGIVRKHAIARRLILGCTEILQDAYDQHGQLDELVARAEQVAARVSDSTITAADMRPFNDVVLASIDALNDRIDNGRTRVLDCGLDALGECMGLVPGGLTIVAGRPGSGKTAIAVRVARHLAREGKRVYFVTLEMTASELAERMLAAESRVDGSALMRGRISQDDRRAVVDHSMCMATWQLFLDDAPTRSMPQIGAMARRVARRHGKLDLVIVDYLQLVEPENTKDPRQEQVAKISRMLKRLARELGTPVMCLAQVNREVEDTANKRPRLSHLRESGAIEQDADAVMFAHRPIMYIEGKVTPYGQAEDAELILAKNRNGPVRIYEALYFHNWMSWENKAGPQFANQEAAQAQGGSQF